MRTLALLVPLCFLLPVLAEEAKTVLLAEQDNTSVPGTPAAPATPMGGCPISGKTGLSKKVLSPEEAQASATPATPSADTSAPAAPMGGCPISGKTGQAKTALPADQAQAPACPTPKADIAAAAPAGDACCPAPAVNAVPATPTTPTAEVTAPAAPVAPGAPAAPAVAATPAQGIQLEAFLPLGSGCQGPMVDYLKGLETKYAGKIKLTIFDFSQEEGQKLMESRGLHCLTILVNGKDRFSVTDADGKTRETWFNKPPAAGNWKQEDLETVIQSVLGGK